MTNYAKVKGHPNLIKDLNSGVILNINKTEIEAARLKKQRAKQQEEDLSNLKNEVSEIKNLLNKLIEKL